MAAEEVQSGEKKQSFRSHPPLFNRPHPWLVITHGNHEQRQTFYNLSEGRYYTKIIPELRNRFISNGGGNGWIYLEEYDSDYSCLLNILTMEKVELPPLLENGSIIDGCCIISSPPTDPDCRVMLYKYHGDTVITCKPGDENFVKLLLDHDIPGCFITATISQGKVYGLIKPQSALVIADATDPSRFREVQLKQDPQLLFGGSKSYLVESCGQILLIQQDSLCLFSKEFVFKVFLADFSKMAWVRLRSIGERAIFLNPSQGFSCSTAELGQVVGDSIYFTHLSDRNMYIFNLQDQSISISLPCPIVSSRHSNLEWIMMPSTNTL